MSDGILDRLRPFAAPAALVGLVRVTRLPRLGRPRAMVFDEVYYALDAADLLRHGVESSPAHPPLAKWFIAAGMLPPVAALFLFSMVQ